MSIKRFGVSLDSEYLTELEYLVKRNKFPNRSQAIRFLIEKNMVETKWECNNMVAGIIMLVYDHHKSDICTRLHEIQHQHRELILSVQHVHIDSKNCMESVMVKGQAYQLTELGDKLCSLKGIRHGKLTMTAAG